uniref:Uncharacterized protein n=1 Tax=Panagrolaimus sp. JU765 TaxID=591449 RepID=A0AC34RIE7_9BILA
MKTVFWVTSLAFLLLPFSSADHYLNFYNGGSKNDIVKNNKYLNIKLLRQQRANNPEPSDNVIGSFGTILWKPRSKLRQKDFDEFY